MFCKDSTGILLILSVQLALAMGQNSRELLSLLTHGKQKDSAGNNDSTSSTYKDDNDVDGRYSNRQNNGLNRPENINGAFNLSGGSAYSNGNNKYPGNAGNGYGSTYQNEVKNDGSNYSGTNTNALSPLPENSLTNNAINYPSGNSNNYKPNSYGNSAEKGGQYYPGNSNGNGQYFPGNNGGYDPIPQQGQAVAFSAIRANTYANSGNSRQRIRFERTVTDVGYGWNPSDSYFECYYPGTYVFSWSVVSPSNEETRVSLYENGRETGHHVWGDRNGYQSASNTAVLTLRKGSRVELRLTEGRLYEPSSSSRGYNSFSGFKLN